MAKDAKGHGSEKRGVSATQARNDRMFSMFERARSQGHNTFNATADKQAAAELAQGVGAKSAPVPVHGGATGRSDAPNFMSTYENSLETHAKQAGAGDAFTKAANASHEHALAAGRTSGEESMRHMDLAEAHAENARAIGEAAKNYNGVMERNPSYNNLRAKGDAYRSVQSATRVANATHHMDPWRKK